jgi:hypothetical protein
MESQRAGLSPACHLGEAGWFTRCKASWLRLIEGVAVAQSLDGAPGEPASVGKSAMLIWRKSTWSIANGQCIEVVALADGRLAVRDSMDKAGSIAKFNESQWRRFTKEIKEGDFDAL